MPTADTADRPPRPFHAGGELLLLEPSALEKLWPPFCEPDDEDDRQPYEVDGSLAIIEISGPLDQRSDWWRWWDGYDAIAKRTCAALNNDAIDVVALRIDSPGGVVAGCFEACDQILAAKAASGKRVVAIVDEMACSASFALACVADEILAPPSAVVGSVGVVATYMNVADALKENGVRVAVLSSGKQKADGSPYRPWSDEALARMKADIDYLAGLFFDRVAGARRMTAQAVQALEAGCFRGQAAIDAGLVDRVLPTADAYIHARNLAVQKRSQRPAGFTFSARVRAVSQEKQTRMKSIAITLGLPEEATEADVLAAIVKLKGIGDELCSTTGKGTSSEALGAVRGLVQTKAAYDLLLKAQAEQQHAAREAAVEAIWAEAVASGKRTPVQVEAARASRKAGTLVLDTDEKVAAYRAEIEASPSALPPTVRQAGDGALIGKPWGDMRLSERAKLRRENPQAAAALQKAHEDEQAQAKAKG